MKSIYFENQGSEKNSQIIDANLDRAKEGLRVVEDWCRFYLTNKDLVIQLKDWRQQLGTHHSKKYKFARCISTDQGIGLTHPAQEERSTSEEIVSANCSRVQEALRVLEEFARTTNPPLSKIAVEIRYGLYEIEIKILKSSLYLQRLQKLKSCNLCLITEPQEKLIETITLSLEAGIGMVQYRCKNSTDIKKFKEAEEICSICKQFNALFIVNDRIDIAIAVNADGVHLGQDDLPTSVSRKIIGEEKLIGRSTHSKDQIKAASNQEIDYIGVGPVSYSKSKKVVKPLNMQSLKEINTLTNLPWFAIGGVNILNLKELRSVNVQRIAVIDAIMNSDDPQEATRQLLQGLQ